MHFLNDPLEADLYQVTLNAGDQLNAAIGAQTAGSGLQSLLRIFAIDGTPMALDDQLGGDPSLTFQAATAGSYFVGVSSAPNDGYNPNVADSGSAGGTTGLYTLNLRVTPGTALQPDVTGSSFRLDQPTAAWGDTISGSFRIENRGGLDAPGFSVQVILSSSNRFDGSVPSQPLTITLKSGVPADLGPGAAYTDQFSAQLPASPPANFPTSGPLYVGLLIGPGPGDTNASDKSGVHSGEEWETSPSSPSSPRAVRITRRQRPTPSHSTVA
jgi:hypothetical protein